MLQVFSLGQTHIYIFLGFSILRAPLIKGWPRGSKWSVSMQGLRQSDKKEYEIPITNCMTILVLFLVKFCYVATKKKVPFEVYKRIFWKKCTNKSLHILRGKMSEVDIFREWVLEVEVARTMQDSLQHFYFPVCPLAKFGSFLFQIIASPRTRLE